MKYILTVTLIAALCSANINTTAQDLRLEFIIGPALTSIRGGDEALLYKPTVNPVTGVGVSVGLRDRSYLYAQCLYELKAAKTGVVFAEYGDPQRIRTDYYYISTPVQWRYEFGNKLRFQTGFGVYGACLVYQEYLSDISTSLTDVMPREPNKPFDFGASFSATLYIPLKQSTRLFVGFNDNVGLTDTRKQYEVIKHNSLAFTTGVSVKLR